MSDPDADMVMAVLLASPNRDQPGALLSAAKAYAALKSSRERTERLAPPTEQGASPHMNAETTVNVSGTFSEKQRHDNGLNRVANYMDANRIAQVVVVGIAEWHSRGETKTGTKMAVSLVAIEPGIEADGSDPDGLGQQLRDVLDKLRKRQGLASVADTLFSAPRDAYDFEPGGDSGPAELDGQGELPIRMGADGEHEVPPPSAEEVAAELAEAQAAGVPVAEFSGSKA